jgi:hypothetical protein
MTRRNVYNKRNEAREERLRQELEAGLISDRFPEVSNIVVKMEYVKEGTTSLLRTLNFYPESHAYFRMSCLGEGCEDGGLDLTRAITTMIKKHKTSAKGKLSCKNNDPEAVHADMVYEISMEYV